MEKDAAKAAKLKAQEVAKVKEAAQECLDKFPKTIIQLQDAKSKNTNTIFEEAWWHIPSIYHFPRGGNRAPMHPFSARWQPRAHAPFYTPLSNLHVL